MGEDKKNEGAEERSAFGAALDAIAKGSWLYPDHRDLLTTSPKHLRLSPNDLPDVLRALDLHLRVVDFAMHGPLGEDAAADFRESRASKLINALRVELEALAIGTKSVGLAPNIIGQARNYKSAHPDHILMQDEAAAAVAVLVELGGVATLDIARNLVAETITEAGASFNFEAIRAHEGSLSESGLYEGRVRKLLNTAFANTPDDDRPPITRAEWIAASHTKQQIVASIAARLDVVARAAARLQPRVK